MVDKLRVAVLGATGIVGQRFVARLSRHPWFELEALFASERRAGRRYGEEVEWVIDEKPEDYVWDERLLPLTAEEILRHKLDLVFSALPFEVAREIEPRLARGGLRVVSNSSPYRMEPWVPLLNPEVNADHAVLVEKQHEMGWRGWIAKVPNCTTAILTLALKPLKDYYGIRRVIVSTMQAISGAGLRGVPSAMIIDNIIPYIRGEEEKVETESRKILGELDENLNVRLADIMVSASTHRVPVLDGHLEAVFIELERKPESLDEVVETLEEFRGNKLRNLSLPSAPRRPIIVRREEDRPQPRLDRMEGGGMSVTVGRIRWDTALNGIKMVVLGHNTVRGAAGNGVLIAELMKVKGYL